MNVFFVQIRIETNELNKMNFQLVYLTIYLKIIKIPYY